MSALHPEPVAHDAAPRISVVIVGYCSRAPLERCLASLERCLDTIDFEVVLVDNASGDGTGAWVATEHPWVRLIGNATNAGFTRGVNQGAAAARGALLFVLNPDCEVGADALAALADAAERPGTAAAAPALLGVDGTRARSCGRFPDLWALICDHLGLAAMSPDSRLFGRYKYGGVAAEALDRVDWASGAALMIPRTAWAEVGGFDEGIFMFMEEVDWCRRAAARGYAVRFLPDVSIVHVGQCSSRQAPSATYLHNLRSRVHYFRKHHGAWAGHCARGVLALSLVLKWLAARVRRGRREQAHLYAAGLEAIWTA